MASYKIVWKRSAAKELKKLPKQIIRRVLEAVEALSSEPQPVGSRKIVGTINQYRLRVGDYRVIYALEDEILCVEIVRVRHRKDVYKRH
jgi:mRNA interferase RelE/StbE